MKVNLIGINCKYIHTNLAIRSLKQYAEQFNLDSEINIFEYTINNNIDDILEDIYLNKPDVIGFSVYLWNVEMTKNIIKELKKVLPRTKIIVGGPEVTFYSKSEFTELGCDFLVKRYGEKTFYEVLYTIENNLPLTNLKSVIVDCGDGIIFENNDLNIVELSEIPFVYENNLDDFENKIIYYEASRGCPYSCQYCLSSTEDGLQTLPIERVVSDLAFFIENKVLQVKFCDRTFNANKTYAKNIWSFIIDNDNGFTNFHFELSAEIFDDSMLNLLKTARVGLIQFEIGIQSTNIDTLSEVARSINTEKVFKNVRLLNDLGNIHLHTDLIVGLPFEDIVSFKKSFNDVYSLRAEQLQIGFLKLLKGSELRKNADKHDMLYKDYAPYEILSNKWLSYDDVLTLKGVENMVEIYYNSGSFKTTIEYMVSLYPTPFDFYMALSIFYSEQEFQKLSHKKIKLYEHLYEFAKVTNVDLSIISQLLKFDILTHENLSVLPDHIETDSNLKWDYLNNDEFLDANLGCYINDFDKKAIARNIRFEKFSINVLEFSNKNENNDIELTKLDNILMFDYLNKISNKNNPVIIKQV